MTQDVQEFLHYWEKDNNPLYPIEMSWDRLKVNIFLKDYKLQLINGEGIDDTKKKLLDISESNSQVIGDEIVPPATKTKTMDDRREFRKNIIAEITMNGFDFMDRSSSGEPILLGGYEYQAMRDDYIIAYNVHDKNICVQKYDGARKHINWQGEFIMQWEILEDLSRLYIFLIKKGLEFKEH